jgi:hypothetical protein
MNPVRCQSDLKLTSLLLRLVEKLLQPQVSFLHILQLVYTLRKEHKGTMHDKC